MYFRMLQDAASGVMSYLLADPDVGEAVLIDPRGADIALLGAMLDERRLRLRWVLRTHEHDAQLAGEAAALSMLDAPIVEHRVPQARDGVLVFGHEHLRVLATPGHTADCLSFLWRDRLFCGGLMTADACPYQPRPAMPEALWDSATRQVFALPAETLLFSAHARGARAVSTVHEQRHSHPWFGGASRDDFLSRLNALPFDPPDIAHEQALRPQH
jgi:glyoxylase-like metal-dependent hydrolase (beta-lactamase superfamily II)